MKRLLDLAGALAGLFILWPLFLVIAAAVKLSSHGPVFYRANRIGRGGVPFRLLKFRTMKVNDGSGPVVTTAGDSRVTAVGRVLRRFKLDELPQLVNVLRGEMSLVGPRPEDPRYVAMYTATQRRILDFLPGITSAASLRYRHEEQLLTGPDWERTYIDVVMPEKIAIDVAYLERRTLRSDLGVIGETLLAIFR
jgi:lipopolysaccharide/colanic/teichoic acid biosynthesis glycosyltransferase